MDYSMKKLRQDEKGFTLVELAVVMIIIGILIGGILKGQELITNARVTSSISQMEALGAAYNGFRDQFNALPGDMLTANVRLNGCTGGAACVNGDGSGLIGSRVGAVPVLAGVANGENSNFFYHLLAGGFITGMDGTAPLSFGTSNPTAPIGGGFIVGDSRTGVTGFTAGELRPGPHLVLTGAFANVAAASTGILTPQQAANLDRRLDDGAPDTGSVIGQAGNAADCRSAVAVYAGTTAQVCSVAYRL